MLVDPHRPQAGAHRWRRYAVASITVLLLCVLSVSPYLVRSTEVVRMRNALLVVPEQGHGFDWTPQTVPRDFKLERGPADPVFVDAVRRLGLANMNSDWERVTAISQHLLSHPELVGSPIQSNLRDTYRQILERGTGYCGDFTRVFMGLALAAGIPVRAWAFSLDGFGGHGHIWPEVWNRQLQRWQLIDIFNNFYFHAGDGVAVSAIGFRSALLAQHNPLQPARLAQSARPGYALEDKMWDWYQQGAAQWYMVWGNNVFSYDNAVMVRNLGRFSRSLEQLDGIAIGAYPQVSLWVTGANLAQVQALWRLRAHLWGVAWLGLASALGAVVFGFAWLGRRGTTRDSTHRFPRVALVGPLPPPSGGMANQSEQFVRLLASEGVSVDMVQTNTPYRPHWVANIPLLRAVFRLVPYLVRLWVAAGRVQVLHVKANSGWAWHLFVAPALLVARLRAVPVVVSYHGGNADAFFSGAPAYVLKVLARVALRVTPSVFLQRVFARYGLSAQVIPNVVDLARFVPVPRRAFGDAPHLVVTRNLEAIYDIPTAIRAFAMVKDLFPQARLTVAGSGPELVHLQALAQQLQVDDAVHFCGRIDNACMAALYASADCALNPSTVDNMPVSILEAFASGVPVVSTCAGGIPDMLEDGVSGLLVPVGDAQAMAGKAIAVLQTPAWAEKLVKAGLAEAQKYSWAQVRAQWLQVYPLVAAQGQRQ